MAPAADPLPPLIVPLDGSDEAERALDVAVAVALPAGLALVSTGWSGDPDADRASLSAVAERLASAGAAPEVVLEPGRPPAEVIVAEADRRGAAVCMATRGRGGLRRALFGSVAEAVVRNAPGPVLLAGPALTEPAGSGPIVMCFDGSDVSTSILPDVVRWAGALDRDVRVVLVDPAPGRIETGMVGRPVPRPAGAPHAAALEAVASRCRAARIETHVDHVQGRDAGATIIAYAAGVRASVVALATHGRSGLRRTTMGSVAADVVRGASCPVLVRRPEDTGSG
jgi:nucleotide-binding universal stress UspA family protein